MKATRTTAAVLSAAMAATLLAGCGGSSATSTAASTSTESTAESTSTAAAAPAEKKTLEYWYHSADPVADAYFEDYFAKINAEQDQYEIKYTSFSFADFQEKFQKHCYIPQFFLESKDCSTS